jgi:ribonuclease BN (tRNA processing enzyme)
MKVRFIGCGDAFGSGGRFNTCFLVEAAQARFLVDCGASSLVAMRQFGVDPNGVETIFISHLHGDHFGGLPFFILDAQFYSRRTAPLRLVGPPGFALRLRQAMEAFFPGSADAARRFETEIVEIAPGETAAFGAVTLTAFQVQHECAAPPLALRFACEGKVLAYSGDTVWTDALIEAGRGADLFIVEALSYTRPIPQHMDYPAYRANAARIGAKRTVLTHMGPDMLAHQSEADEEKAEDGLIVDV